MTCGVRSKLDLLEDAVEALAEGPAGLLVEDDAPWVTAGAVVGGGL